MFFRKKEMNFFFLDMPNSGKNASYSTSYPQLVKFPMVYSEAFSG